MNKQETAQNLRKVANFMKGLIQAADDIEAIGSMEGATVEAIRARDVAVAERETALAELADAKASGKKAVAAAKERADKMVADAEAAAKGRATEIVSAAENEASVVLANCGRQCSERVANARTNVARAEQALADLAVQKSALTAEVADLESKAKASQAEFDKLTKALDKIKAQFKIGD